LKIKRIKKKENIIKVATHEILDLNSTKKLNHKKNLILKDEISRKILLKKLVNAKKKEQRKKNGYKI
jgi:hypothetical protein